MKKLLFGVFVIFLSVIIMRFASNYGSTTESSKLITAEIRQSNLTLPDSDPTPPFEEWGLGKNISKEVSLNTDYNWYIDQMHTGYNSSSNCGPTCTIMAAKWSDKNFPKTVIDARNSAKNTDVDGWWYIHNIHSFLVNNNIPSYRDKALTIDQAISILDQGHIMIVNIYTGYITYNRNGQERTGRFYYEENGHFIILKGYCIVDNIVYFEVYDPNNFDRYYNDGTQKGKDRYYLATQVISAMNNWWNEYLIISPK